MPSPHKQNIIRNIFEAIGYAAAVITIITFVMPDKGLIIVRGIEQTLEERLPAPITAQIEFLELFQFEGQDDTMLRYYNLSKRTSIKNFEVHLFHIENNKPIFIHKYEDSFLGNDAVRTISDIGIRKRLRNKVIMCINYKDNNKIEITPLTAPKQKGRVVYKQEAETKKYWYKQVDTCDDAVRL